MHMLSSLAGSSIPCLALYAETHFRFFRLFPSYLFARRPEVIFDAPRRLDPGADLPVILIVNDCRRFPAELSGCAIALSRSGAPARRYDFPDLRPFEIDHPLKNSLRAFVFPISRAELSTGTVDITCTVTVSMGRRREVVVNDNLRTTGKKPFTCYVSDERFPGSGRCAYGDLHVHSHYSQSHVEFGPPLAVIQRAAQASGLSFVGVTDHSYDLACSMDDYLAPDPDRNRWRSFLAEIAAFGSTQPFLIPGEEISCLNADNLVVHLCGLNLHDYLPGSLDGARRGRRREKQPTLPDTIRAIHAQGGVAFAAHPGIRPGLLQRIFLHRGEWSSRDRANDLDAMQIVNNGFSPSFYRGRAMWLAMLGKGRRIPLVAGNDAHGDFNRFRSLVVPFVAIGENNDRYMGFGRTGIYGPAASPDRIVAGMKSGATFVTTGPYIEIGLPEPDAVESRAEPFVRAISSAEFGPLKDIVVYGFTRETGKETLLCKKNFAGSPATLEAEFRIALPSAPLLYLRAEVVCTAATTYSSMAYTSPVFLDH
jgi:hypothetical protein